MPIVKTVQGNLIKMFKEKNFGAIVHGCNCFHTMGAGIAGQIAHEFPISLMADQCRSDYADPSKLGSYTYIKTEYGYIINAYTQYLPGKSEQTLLNNSISKAFIKLNRRFVEFPSILSNMVVGIPMIGSGIAGGDWNLIMELIHVNTPNLDIVVVEYDGK